MGVELTPPTLFGTRERVLTAPAGSTRHSLRPGDDRTLFVPGTGGSEVQPLDEQRFSFNRGPIVAMLIGRRGHGKTLLETTIARYKLEKIIERKVRYRLLSNYHIKFFRTDPETGQAWDYYSPYIIDEAMEYPWWLNDAHLFLDEIQTAATGRRSMSRGNVFLSTFLTQLRHRNVEVTFTTQFPQVVDYQLLLQVDLFVEVSIARRDARGLPIALNLAIHDWWGQWTGRNWRKPWPPRPHDADGYKTLFGVRRQVGAYDTGQIIAPTFAPDTTRARMVQQEEERMDTGWNERQAELERAFEENERDPGVRYTDLEDLFSRMPSTEFDISRFLGPADSLSDGRIRTVRNLAAELTGRGFQIRKEDHVTYATPGAA